jgi:hypothetical protein
MAYNVQGGVRYPGVTLYPNKITGLTGGKIEIDWSAPQLREIIGSMFGYLLKAEWVRTDVAYNP